MGTGPFFSTGSPKDTIDVPGVGKVEWSLVDLANPTVFVEAEALGLKGTEEAKDILNDKEIDRKMEAIRSHAGVVYGVAKDDRSVDIEWPVTPICVMVMPPSDDTTIQGVNFKAANMSLRRSSGRPTNTTRLTQVRCAPPQASVHSFRAQLSTRYWRARQKGPAK